MMATEQDRRPCPDGSTVADVMVRRPKTMSRTTSVDQALDAFADDHVHLLLLVEGERLVGTLLRADLPAQRGAVVGRATAFATLAGRTVAPTTGADQALADMTASGLRRLAVVDDDGHLLGLLCLKRRGDGFCSDEDVADRRRCRDDRASSDAVRGGAPCTAD